MIEIFQSSRAGLLIDDLTYDYVMGPWMYNIMGYIVRYELGNWMELIVVFLYGCILGLFVLAMWKLGFRWILLFLMVAYLIMGHVHGKSDGLVLLSYTTVIAFFVMYPRESQTITQTFRTNTGYSGFPVIDTTIVTLLIFVACVLISSIGIGERALTLLPVAVTPLIIIILLGRVGGNSTWHVIFGAVMAFAIMAIMHQPIGNFLYELWQRIDGSEEVKMKASAAMAKQAGSFFNRDWTMMSGEVNARTHFERVLRVCGTIWFSEDGDWILLQHALVMMAVWYSAFDTLLGPNTARATAINQSNAERRTQIKSDGFAPTIDLVWFSLIIWEMWVIYTFGGLLRIILWIASGFTAYAVWRVLGMRAWVAEGEGVGLKFIREMMKLYRGDDPIVFRELVIFCITMVVCFVHIYVTHWTIALFGMACAVVGRNSGQIYITLGFAIGNPLLMLIGYLRGKERPGGRIIVGSDLGSSNATPSGVIQISGTTTGANTSYAKFWTSGNDELRNVIEVKQAMEKRRKKAEVISVDEPKSTRKKSHEEILEIFRNAGFKVHTFDK